MGSEENASEQSSELDRHENERRTKGKKKLPVPVAAERTAKTHLLPSHVLYCSLKTGLAASLTDAASLIKTEAIEKRVVEKEEQSLIHEESLHFSLFRIEDLEQTSGKN